MSFGSQVDRGKMRVGCGVNYGTYCLRPNLLLQIVRKVFISFLLVFSGRGLGSAVLLPVLNVLLLLLCRLEDLLGGKKHVSFS